MSRDRGRIETVEREAAGLRALVVTGDAVLIDRGKRCRGGLRTRSRLRRGRLRTSRLTAPIVGMALIFMALVIYPALSFS